MVNVSQIPTPGLFSNQSQGLSTQQSTADLPGGGSRAKNEAAEAANQGFAIQDTVSISPEALRAAENAKLLAKASSWADFYPGRDGFATTNLAAAGVDPAGQPFSQNRPFAEVAQVARESLDGRYDAMRESGEPFDENSYEGRDWYSLMGELDRRALYAVASNEGGAFTQREQDIAQSIMSQQQGNAMGFSSGPQSSGEGHLDPFLDNDEGRFKAMNAFLDSVSVEERATSADWALQRASGQRIVDDMARDRGDEPAPLETNNSLLTMLIEAVEAERAQAEAGEPASDQREAIMERYGDRIAEAIEENKSIFELS